MTGERDDEVRQVLVDDKIRADRENKRQLWMTLLGSACFYVGFQLVHAGTRLLAELGKPESEKNPANLSWDPTAGIGTEEATSIVLGLAAFIVTINVAVFAARLAPVPHDDASVLDLDRWQRRMQFLASCAGQTAVAVAVTQFSHLALGVGLLFISFLAVIVADLQVAGRLTALRIEVDTAKKFSDHAAKEFERLITSLEPSVQAKVQGARVPSWSKASALVYLPVAALVAIQSLMLVILFDWENLPQNLGREDFFQYYFWAVLAVGGILLFTTGAALNVMIHVAAADLIVEAGLGPKVASHRGLGIKAALGLGPAIAATFLAVLWAVVAERGTFRAFLTFLLVVTIFVVLHLLIRYALRTGRGPGMTAVWLALADRFEDLESAKKRYLDVSVAHQLAMKVSAVRASQARTAQGIRDRPPRCSRVKPASAARNDRLHRQQ